MKRVETVPFNSLHDSILKNTKMHSLCHLLFYLAHVTHATRSHISQHKNCTTFVFNRLAHMMSLWLRSFIPRPTPSMTIKLISIDLSLINKSHPIPIMNKSNLDDVQQIQTCTAHSWLWITVFYFLMTQDMLHEVHASLCWCSLPLASAHSKHSSHLQHYLVHQLWWAFIHTHYWEKVMLLEHPPLEGSTWGTHSLQLLQHVDWGIPNNFDMSRCYAHAATWLYHSTSSPMVMLSWVKTTFTIVRENILRDHTTSQNWEEEPHATLWTSLCNRRWVIKTIPKLSQ